MSMSEALALARENALRAAEVVSAQRRSGARARTLLTLALKELGYSLRGFGFYVVAKRGDRLVCIHVGCRPQGEMLHFPGMTGEALKQLKNALK